MQRDGGLGCRHKRLEFAVLFLEQLVNGHLPGRQRVLPGDDGGDEIAAIVVGMSSFVSQRQQCMWAYPADDLERTLNRFRQPLEELLIDYVFGGPGLQKFNVPDAYMAEGQPRFVLPQQAISLARTVSAPEIWVERRAVGAEQYVRFSHALHERGTGDRLIVRMRHDDQSPSQYGSKGLHGSFDAFPSLEVEICDANVETPDSVRSRTVTVTAGLS